MLIQNDFRGPLFEFIREASGIDRIYSIIVFGSVARGEAEKKSDIDIAVVFDIKGNVNRLSERDETIKIAHTVEEKYGVTFQIVFADRELTGFDTYFVQQLFREGIMLFGKQPSIKAEKLELEPYALICYSLAGLPVSDKMRVRKALYGWKTVKKSGKKTYKSEDEGLLKRLGGKPLNPATILVPFKNARILTDALKRFRAKQKLLNVWLPGRFGQEK